ncbi:hypothetical protein MNB_SM-5-880 [hydrothermal vent metagenome]|uniref:AAA-ATPase-like domain-containing protein n=1 Tax=hydrothermal vent metagenome TaxID=652676 RepID=A0A1W1CQS3_9ZZZZ
MNRLPIGIQTFREIRSKNLIYVDKTKEALSLVENGKYYFLSRPRRFGKSLFLDTLKNLFEGNKELFEGLYIYDKYNWDESYPIIKIDWSGDFKTLEKIEYRAFQIMKNNQESLGIECEFQTSASGCFEELIRKAFKKYNKPVVILIDEYDKPILDNINDTEMALKARDFLRGFYVMMKANDAYIKFAFLTGISKFSKANIFSGLNNLEDISLVPEYGNICGYTQENIENEFLEYSQGMDLEKIKVWYNGYYFLKDKIYNPFDLLKFFKYKQFKNYWWESGNPYFLIELIKKNSYYLPKLADLKVDDTILNTFEVDNIKLEVLLYQAGYLTIQSQEITIFDTIEYKLKLPNKEIKISFNDMIIDMINSDADNNCIKTNIYKSLLNAKLEALQNSLMTMFSAIPYNNHTGNNIAHYEGFYASVIYVYFQSLGIEIIGEDVTSKGRIDLTLFVNDIIYIIEFKVNQKGALEQIKANRYADKYKDLDKKIYLVGISFDELERNICEFEWELFKF